MVQHERILLFNSLLASGANVVVNYDKTSFAFADATGALLTNWLPIKGMQKTSKVTPTAEVKLGASVGINDTLVKNTRYSVQVENLSKTYFSHTRGLITYPSVTPTSDDQATLKTALYSDLVRRILLDNQALVTASLIYKCVVAHNAVAALTADAAVSQAGNTGFSAKLVNGSLVNGSSTVYIYAVAGTIDAAKALTIGGTTTSGTAITATIEGIFVEDKYNYDSYEFANRQALIPSTILSAGLTVSVVRQPVMAVGIGSALVRDRQVYTPGRLDMMYGNSEYSFTEAPDASKTYTLFSVKVWADTAEGERGDGSKPSIPVVYHIYADTSDGTKLTAFEARLVEATLLA